MIAASKDPKLAEYVRKRDFEGTPEPAPAAEPRAEGNSFVIHKHRRDAAALRRPLGARRRPAVVGRPEGPARRSRATSVSRSGPRITRSSTASSKARSRQGHYGAGEVRIFDDGWYEPVEWTDTKVSFRLHGRRYPGLEFHFVKTRTDWLAFLAARRTRR